MRTMRVNLIGTYNVLEAAIAAQGLERLVEFSTSEVFGTYAFRVAETSVTTTGSVGEARWTYAVSKLAGEHMAHAYHDELGLPSVSVRPFNVYGPRQIGGGAIRAFIEAALAGRDLTVHGDGSQIRAWCYVDDLVDAILLCLEHPRAVGESFNIGNPRSAVTIYDLATRIKRLTGAPGEIVFQEMTYEDVELRIPNVDKARELLGFEAQVELDDGLARTIEWYRESALIRLAWPDVGPEEAAAAAEVLEGGQLTMGQKVTELEEELARACGVEHAVAVSSGTAALHLAVLALGIGEGDEVLVPAYTFPATANVVALAGARPVLVDVDPKTMNLDPARVYDAVTPRTQGRPRGASVRPAARLGGAAERRAAGRPSGRGRGRRARRSLARHALRRPGRARVPLVPSAEDRLDGRGRGGHDDGRRAGRRGAAASPPRDLDRRRLRHLRARLQLPPLGCAVRDRARPAPPAGGAVGGAPPAGEGVRRTPGRDRGDAGAREGRPARLAGLRRPARPRATGRSMRCGRRASRPRSEPTPSTGSPPTATRDRSPAPTPASSGRSRCRSIHG